MPGLISIKDIKVGTRLRKDYGDIEGLAASIAQHGLLQPIVLDTDNNLIAGGRRLAAHVHLGRAEIEFNHVTSLGELERRELELEENLRRKDLTWQEEVRGLRQLYEAKQEKYGTVRASRFDGGDGYGVERAAEELDRSVGAISMDIALARGLDEFPDLEKEKTKSAAFKRYRRLKETQLRTAIASRNIIAEAAEDADAAADEAEDPELGAVRQPIRKAAWKGRGILYHADARDVLKRYPKESVDCIVTDPPYALGMFREGQATSGARLAEQQGTMYDDDPAATMDMLDQVFFHAAQVLKPDGHAYVFFHMTRYEPIFLMLRKHFGSVDEVPIVWIKNTPGIGDPNTTWVYAYEPCFWVHRGRNLVKPQAFNYLKSDTVTKKIHATEKPVQLLRHLVQASCVPGEVVLDPFSGSGSTLVAAAQLGCKFVGIEKHEPFFRSTTERIATDLALDTPATDDAA